MKLLLDAGADPTLGSDQAPDQSCLGVIFSPFIRALWHGSRVDSLPK